MNAKNEKAISIGITAILVISVVATVTLLMAGTTVAAGTTYYVNAATGDDTRTNAEAQSPATPWKTIGHGVTNATTGDIIIVAAGTYTEDLAIGKSLALHGAGSGSVTLNGVHTIPASGVSITGFTFNPNGGIGVTIDSSSSPISNIAILNNVFDLTSGAPIGILLGGYTSPQKVSNVTMNYNTFNGPTNKIANPWKIGGWFGNPVDCEVDDVNFEHNLVNNCSTPINLQDQNITDVLINNNTFRNTDGVVYVWGEGSPAGVLSQFVFTSNDVDSTNSYGVGIDLDGATVFNDSNFGAGNRINNNNFVGIPGAYEFDAVSIVSTNLTSYTLNATCNWWGSVNGPTHASNTFNVGSQGDTVSDNVDFYPWLDAAYPGGNATAPVRNVNTSECFNTIQAAINDSNTQNGHTITVSAGTYTESVVIDKQLTITGTGAATTTIDGTGATTVLDINATGITLGGFSITNATYGISADVGGFSVLNNTFSDVDEGVHLKIDEDDLAADYTIDAIMISGNKFNTSSDGVYGYIGLDYNATLTGFNVSIGNIDILDNEFNTTTDYGVSINDIYVKYLNDGCISVGEVNISANEFYEGSYGIDFFGRFRYLTNTTVTAGDVIINGNTFENQTSRPIDMDYYDAEYWYGTTTGTYGDLVITGNTITSEEVNTKAIGINDYAYFEYFEDEATLTVGNLYVEDNEINVSKEGVYLYYDYAYELDDDTSITMGDVSIKDNTINSDSSYGIYLEYYCTGYDLYGNSSVTLGDVHIEDNEMIKSNYASIYVDYDDYVAYEMEDNATFLMGDLYIENNTIESSTGEGIYLEYYDLGNEMYGNSSATLGEVHITDNEIESSDEALYVYYEDVAYDMYNNARLLMGDIYVQDNNLSADDDGIYLYYYDYEVGYDMDDDAYAELPDYVITGNTFNVTGDGIYLYTYENPYEIYEDAIFDFGGALIDNNTFNGLAYNPSDCMDYGIYFYYYDFCYYTYDNSTTIIGDVTITNNRFYDLDDEAIYIDYVDIGYGLEDNAILEVGDLIIADNVIDGVGDSDGIDVEYYDVYSYENSTVTIGTLDITGNEISTVYEDGIDVEYYLDADDNSTITIGRGLIQNNTIDGCNGDGVSVEMDLDTEAGAVARLEDLLIDGNSISNCGDGIYFSDVKDATITCNDILGNTGGSSCSGIYLGGDSEGNVLRLNNIVGNLDDGVYNDNTGETVDAESNWWGSASGPGGAGTGTGDNVSSYVDYEPWLEVAVEDGTTETATDDTVDVTTEADTTVIVDGTATVTVAKYAANPEGNPPSGFSAVGDYIDVYVDDTSGVTEIEIRNYYTDAEIAGLDESSLRLRYWNGAAWVACSNSGVNTAATGGYSGYVWAKITATSSPTLAYLQGGVFGALGTTPTSPPSGGGSGTPRDSDGDGYSDFDEMLAGTNPNDPNDYPNKPTATPVPTATATAKPTVKPSMASVPTPVPATPTPEAATPTPEEPGFGALFAIAGLFAVAYLVRRKQ